MARILDGRLAAGGALVVGSWLSLLAATSLIDLHRDHAADLAEAYREACRDGERPALP